MKPEQTVQLISKMIKNIREAKRLEVVVGLPKGEATSRIYEGGVTVLEVGIDHEYGKDNIPQRSFLRTPFIKKKDDMPTFTLKEFRAVMEGKRDVKTALGRIGLEGENMVRESFRNNGYGTWKPLSQETIDKKGSSKPLIDTGTLRNSIVSVVRGRK